MRKSTKRKIRNTILFFIVISAGALAFLNSGILEIGTYKSLPSINTENIYDVNKSSTGNIEFDNILNKFKESALDPSAIIYEVVLYDRQDRPVQSVTDLFCEIHTRTGSIECVNYYILTCKHTDETGWYFKNFTYDSQREMKYFPYSGLIESEIRDSILGQKMDICDKTIELTESNLASLTIVNQNTDFEAYVDDVTVEIKVLSDLLEYTGRVDLKYSFLGSTWNLDSYEEQEFLSGYNEEIRPSFTGEDYKKIIADNPYKFSNGELVVAIKENQIKNIEIVSSSNNKNGNFYTENIAFDVMTDKALIAFTAECIYEYNGSKTIKEEDVALAESVEEVEDVLPNEDDNENIDESTTETKEEATEEPVADGKAKTTVDDNSSWTLKEINYTHTYEESSLCGLWAGRYIVIMPETEDVPVKKKAAVLINFDIGGLDENGQYKGTTNWSEIKTGEDGNEVASNMQTTDFIATFDNDNSEVFFTFMKPIKYSQQYANFALYYDFAEDSLKVGNYEFLRLIPEITEEEQSTEDETETEAKSSKEK